VELPDHGLAKAEGSIAFDPRGISVQPQATAELGEVDAAPCSAIRQRARSVFKGRFSVATTLTGNGFIWAIWSAGWSTNTG